MDRVEQFSRKLNAFCELNDVKTREELLTELRVEISSFSRNEADNIVRNINFPKIFSQLTSKDENLLGQTCEILKALFLIIEPGFILIHFSNEISSMLLNPEPIVKISALNELCRTTLNSKGIIELLKKVDILKHITEMVADEHLGVAKHAMDVLKNIGKTKEGLQALYSGTLLRTIAKILSQNDVLKFRVYEIIVGIAKNSPEGLEASANSGFLQSLFAIMDNDDILIQLNALEIITQLALTSYGFKYLEEQGILQNLVQKIAHANENPFSNMLVPGFMKLFGNMARCYPEEIFSKYPIVISSLFEVLYTDDQTNLVVALDTLGHVANPVNGKYALSELGNAMPSAMKRLNQVIQKMPTEVRICGLNNLSKILDVKRSEQDNRILSLTKLWFDCLCEEPMKMVLSLCRQPFADIRGASLEVLSVLASQMWGQEYIAQTPGAIEFLLDRNIESFSECKIMKFNVIKNLSESEPNVFDAQTMERFQQFVKEGPFYVYTVTEVAIEGGS